MGGGAGGFAFPVSAAPLTRGTIAQSFSDTGTVTPLLQAQLSSVASGIVLAVNAQIGQHVSKGDLLVQIDDGPIRAQLQSAQASLESAQARLAQTSAGANGDVASTGAGLAAARAANQTAQLNLHRDQTLLREGYVSQSTVDDAWSAAMAAQAQLRAAEVASNNAAIDPTTNASVAQANIKNARAEVDVAQSQVAMNASQLAQTQVRAPFDGTVTARDVDPGSLASPNTTLMEVAQVDPTYVDVGLSSDQLPYVKVGTPATVTTSAIPNRVWHGSVKYLDEAAKPGSLTYTARVEIANGDQALRAGMVADVAFVQERKANVVLAPRAAVFQTDYGYSMFVIDGGKAKSIPIDVGLQNDQQMEVSGQGVAPGVQAILNHAATLQPGTPVQVVPPQGQGAPGQGASGGKPAGGHGSTTSKPRGSYGKRRF